MFYESADILYAERFGVSDAAKDKGVLAIGNVIDTQPDYPDTVIASAIWHMEATIDRAVSKVSSGTFEAEDYGQFSFMKYGGGSLAPYGTFENRIPTKIKKLVAERSQEIKDALESLNLIVHFLKIWLHVHQIKHPFLGWGLHAYQIPVLLHVWFFK